MRLNPFVVLPFLTALVSCPPAIPSSARAATLTVCPTGCGYSSVQAAIAAATSGDDIAIGAGTYRESVVISKDVKLVGSGLVVLSGDNGPAVSIKYGATVAMTNISVTRGHLTAGSGGGIRNAGTLTFTNGTIDENLVDRRAGGGGGIDNTGALFLMNSTVSGNRAGYAGGIANTGTLSIINSTIAANRATESVAGGILNDGVVIAVNSTISGNRAQNGGGLVANTGPAGGAESTTLTNTILAGNSARDGPNCSGGVDAGVGGHNLVGNDTGCTITLHGSAGNIIGSARHRVNPKLGHLSANGGPTATFGLLAGSPALGAGDQATCAATPVDGLDQRGYERPPACSIGAWDAGTSPPAGVPPAGVTTPPTGGTDISVNLSLTPNPVHRGSAMTAQIVLRNTGSADERVSISGSVTSPSGGATNANLGPQLLPAGASEELTISSVMR